MSKKYWNSVDDFNKNQKSTTSKNATDLNINNFIDEIASAKTNRRDFLKWCGFSISAAAFAASCKSPVQKAIPYVIKPEEVTPGIPNYYASTYQAGTDYAAIVVKTREGRPIKIEGNDQSPLSNGGTSARVQASVLDLYDDARLRHPLNKGKKISWDKFDEAITDTLSSLAEEEKAIVLLTSSISSPSTRQLIQEFLEKYPNSEWIVYDPVSYAGLLQANEINFGKRFIPDYRFEKASLIVSFDADFLGTWIAPVTFSNRYAKTRDVSEENPFMSKHIQFESRLSLTGANADERIALKPSDLTQAIITLYDALAIKAGAPLSGIQVQVPVDMSAYADALWTQKGKCLVICGSNDPNVQLIINAINRILDNYGNTIDPSRAWLTCQSNDKKMQTLVDRMENGEIGALIMHDCNPVYDYARADKFSEGLQQVDVSIDLAYRMDETASLCSFVGACNHYLESWGDAEPVKGQFSLAQPTIQKLFNTRTLEECLLKWTGKEEDHYSYLRNYWKAQIMPLQNYTDDFEEFWHDSLKAGVFITTATEQEKIHFTDQDLSPVFETVAGTKPSEEFELILYESIALGNGRQSNNPWLLEMPDPISKSTWGNFAALAPADAGKLGVKTNDVIKIGKILLPVLVQPGQATGSISVALGYGRTQVGKAGNDVGTNAYPMVTINQGYFQYSGKPVTPEPTGEADPIAFTQTHDTLEGRPIIHETTLKEYADNPLAGNEVHEEIQKELVTLYESVTFNGPHWGLSVDLNKCIGCSACVISCQAENNVAVVGKDQVSKNRIMHWIRIDRYYSESPENPEVVFQPVMCQQCDNAPCENVCPVAATMHNEEGLNQMAYNRCIGTRYCINNCPYRVRRFNWYAYFDNPKFDYNMNSDLGKMVLNPDAVVRSRGVVEKCSFCVQRIQDAKLKAKMENRSIRDGELQTACMQACPTKAIVFGDLNQNDSKVSQLFENKRNYHLLEELHTLPSVGYLTKVRNKENNNGLS